MSVDYDGMPVMYSNQQAEVTAEAPAWLKQQREREKDPVAFAVRQGRDAFADPFLELSGIKGTGRFAKDPMKNLSGAANVLGNLSTPQLVMNAYNYMHGKPFFDISNEDLEGFANTLDVFGLAAPFVKPITKGLSFAPRLLGKVPKINPNVGLRFADETIAAQKPINYADNLSDETLRNLNSGFAYDDAVIAKDKSIKENILNNVDELKNDYRTEFEKLWGKSYDEQDLLSYAKIKEGIIPDQSISLVNEHKLLNDKFIKDFEVKNIENTSEMNALQDYTGDQYTKFSGPSKGINPAFYKEFMIPLLDDAISRNKTIKDLTVKRGFGDYPIKILRNDRFLDSDVKGLLPGDKFMQGDRYQGTSLYGAPHFYHQKSVSIPKGTSYAFPNKQGLSLTPTELEFLLPKNTIYEVTDPNTFKIIKSFKKGGKTNPYLK